MGVSGVIQQKDESFIFTIILSIRDTMTECMSILVMDFIYSVIQHLKSYHLGDPGTKSYQMRVHGQFRGP